jgi:hypothetical protein
MTTSNSAKLKRSNDRKVANAVSKNGKTPTIANTFGLPAGKAFSCPGATSICESVCYAGKLEKVYKGVRAVLLHNWELLRNADMDTMCLMIDEMIVDFVNDCDKKNAPKLFRITGTEISLTILTHMRGRLLLLIIPMCNFGYIHELSLQRLF